MEGNGGEAAPQDDDSDSDDVRKAALAAPAPREPQGTHTKEKGGGGQLRLCGFKVSHREIYRRYPAHYELLVSRQDHKGNIDRALRALGVFTPDADVVELGAGTGRLTRMVAPWVRSVIAFDSSEHMLTLARERMPAIGDDESHHSPPSDGEGKPHRVQFRVGNNRKVASFGLTPASADIVLAGWTLSYVKAEVWSSATWDLEVKRVLGDLKALLRPTGSIVILETLGTGNEEPSRHNLMYSLLEEAGFEFRWFRSDYRFISWDEAVALARFFFGNKVAGIVEERRAKQRKKRGQKSDLDESELRAANPPDSSEEIGGEDGEDEEDTEVPMLPECTGLWWIRGADLRP